MIFKIKTFDIFWSSKIIVFIPSMLNDLISIYTNLILIYRFVLTFDMIWSSKIFHGYILLIKINLEFFLLDYLFIFEQLMHWFDLFLDSFVSILISSFWTICSFLILKHEVDINLSKRFILIIVLFSILVIFKGSITISHLSLYNNSNKTQY